MLSRPRDSLCALLDRPGGRAALGEAALLVAKAERPSVDVAACLARLDALGAAAREVVLAADHGDPRCAIEAFVRFLFREEGFRGNADDYYDPRNSHLDEVLERRLGIPITLSIVYVEVGRRAGLRPEPVAFPGHFLVKHELPEGPLVISPFDRGGALGDDDLTNLLERHGVDAPFSPGMLATAEPREVIARIARNLKAIYVKKGDTARAYTISDLLVAIQPDAAEEMRDRGIFAAQTGRLDRAIADLVRYTRAIPDTIERRTLRAQIDVLRRARAARN